MKSHSEYVCQQCGYKSPSFLGKCPNCGEWNSLVETLLRPSTLLGTTEGQANLQLENNLFKLSEVKSQHFPRISTGFLEFDRVLGGGIVPGSIILIAGDPGIGKSTLLLQTAMRIAAGSLARGPVSSFPPVSARSVNKPTQIKGRSLSEAKGATLKTSVSLRAVGSPSTTATPRRNMSNVNGQLSSVVLYVTAEESAHQVKIRADRIGKVADSLYILPITEVEGILAASEKVDPKLIIVDSIQTLTTPALNGAAGSVGQVRGCSQILQRFAKESNCSILVVGHVTKEGSVAGPKVLEHLVDGVFNLEGDSLHAYRILRSIKNRFGSTSEVGVFEMTDKGMEEVINPSKIFLDHRRMATPGSVVTATITGDRPILAEVQALTTPAMYGVPTRRVTGLDFSRVQIVIASLARAAKLNLGQLDIFINIAGGLKIDEPAIDLPVALAIASATLNKVVGAKTCAFGEVGLLGELRPVSLIKSRISEAKRMGFDDFVTAERFKTLEEAISYAIRGSG